MRTLRSIPTAVPTLVIAALCLSPAHARDRHGGKGTTTSNPTPANASEAVCRTRARDYAYEKHADPGQERTVFDKCVGH